MFYQVVAIMNFKVEDEAKDFFHDCEVALPKTSIIKPGLPDQETSEAQLNHCNHDLDPPEHCVLVHKISNAPEP